MRKAIGTASLAMAIALAGCGAFNQDGEDNAPRHFAIPVVNEASRSQPFAQPMGEAMPDLAWATEGASECEPWQTRDNGCGRERLAMAEARTPGQAPANRHRVATHHRTSRRIPYCVCTQRPSEPRRDLPTPPVPSPSNAPPQGGGIKP